MAIVQIVQWDDSINSNDILAWRYVNKNNPSKSDELGNWTQLIVRESQEAILFKDGQALDLSELEDIPFRPTTFPCLDG